MATGNLCSDSTCARPQICTVTKQNNVFKSRPRPISTGLLKTLLPLHIQPINLVVFQGSYPVTWWEISSWGLLPA